MPITFNENYRLKKLANLVSHCESILDIGCAQYPNIFLSNTNVTGLDICNAEMPSNYTNFIQGDLSSINKNELQIDAIIAGEILEHLEEPIKFLNECFSLLKPGGILVLSTPNPHSIIESLLTITLSKNYFYTQDHIMLFPQRWLIRMLEIAHFTQVKLFSGGFPFPLIGLIPFPRFLCHQTIAFAIKPKNNVNNEIHNH